MTSDGTITLPDDGEWDDDTLALLRYDPPAVTEPETTSELVLVPGYTQSEWDRRQVEVLKFVEATRSAGAYMRENQDAKTIEVLVRDAALMLGCGRIAATVMSPEGPGTVTPEDTCRYGSNIYAALVTETRETAERKTSRAVPPAAGPARRRRPSQARKTVTGGTS